MTRSREERRVRLRYLVVIGRASRYVLDCYPEEVDRYRKQVISEGAIPIGPMTLYETQVIMQDEAVGGMQ